MRFATAVAALAAALLGADAAKTLFYNIGGPAVGKFCQDPSSLLISKTGSFVYTAPGKGALGALASHRATGLAGKFEYLFPVPGPGTYKVVLGFAETYPTNFKIGARKFDIWVNDKLLYTGWDAFKGAGGANKALWQVLEVPTFGKTLKVSLVKGAAENAMISVIEITAPPGKDMGTCSPPAKGIAPPSGGGGPGPGVVVKPAPGNPAPKPVTPPTPPVTGAPSAGGGSCSASKKIDTGMTGGADHQAHSVAGTAYTVVDFAGTGKVSVTLDGARSHSHYFNPKTGMSGVIKEYKWEANGKVIGTTPKVNAIFPVGKTVVKLTVVDNTGDVACDSAVVTGLASATTGAFCYFYPGLTSLSKMLNVNPKPAAGYKVPAINFPDLASIPWPGKTQAVWTMRCMADLNLDITKMGALGIRRQGRAAIYLYGANEVALAEGPGAGGIGLVPINGKTSLKGTVPVNAVYHKSGPNVKFELSLNGVPVPKSAYSYQQGMVLPIIGDISPKTAEPAGGGLMQIFGQGFVNKPVVYVGKFKAKTTVTSATQLLVTVPSQVQAGGKSVIVYVGNGAGESNAKTLTYAGGAGAGGGGPGKCGTTTVKWENTALKKPNGGQAFFALLTSVALGPDFNYYFGSQDGFVYKVSAGKDLVVISQCKSFKMGQSRSVLGIGFNPWKKAPQPYVTTSTLFRKSANTNTPLKNKIDGWANGLVEALTVGCGCFCGKKTIVSGLPVSHHDHSVNKLQFLPNGDMLISVAGSTNGGHNTPNNLLGGLEESPLSGAILLAKTSKGDAIDGAIKYNQYANPNKAFKTGGADVIVFATGLRNSFGLAQTLKGQIYSTDNGANTGFGLKSTSCTSQTTFTQNVPDELNLIIKGGHYGHPNRNRGRGDAKQCQWGTGYGPVTTFQSSTDGIIEYVSNAFCGNMKGDLVATQYSTTAPSVQGKAFRIGLFGNGQVKSNFVMATYSGVAAENGLHGEVVMPRVGKGMVAVLKPVYTAPAGAPYVVSVTPKIGQGGQQILISGNGFKAGLTAYVGGKVCANPKEISDVQLKCTTPPGTGIVSVEVINPGGAGSKKLGGDFKYL